jgi:S-adenosylmethionine synthetase
VQLAYAIGVARPVSVRIDTFGTARVAEEKIAAAVDRMVDLRPGAIIQRFDLRRPIYSPLAAYGHMGREDLDVAWEKTDLAEDLRKEFA